MSPTSAPLLLAPARSLSGLLWIGIPPAVEDGGVISIAAGECWADCERTGRFRVLPGPSAGPAKVALEDGGSARPLMSGEKGRSAVETSATVVVTV